MPAASRGRKTSGPPLRPTAGRFSIVTDLRTSQIVSPSLLVSGKFANPPTEMPCCVDREGRADAGAADACIAPVLHLRGRPGTIAQPKAPRDRVGLKEKVPTVGTAPIINGRFGRVTREKKAGTVRATSSRQNSRVRLWRLGKQLRARGSLVREVAPREFYILGNSLTGSAPANSRANPILHQLRNKADKRGREILYRSNRKRGQPSHRRINRSRGHRGHRGHRGNTPQRVSSRPVKAPHWRRSER